MIWTKVWPTDGRTFYTNGCQSAKSGDRVMVLAFYTSSIGPLSMYQISFHPLLYFQRYALDKLFTAKMKRGSNSVNTGDRVTILEFCNSPHDPLSVYQVSLNYLQYFERYAPTKSVTDRRTVGRTKRQLYALPSESIIIRIWWYIWRVIS